MKLAVGICCLLLAAILYVCSANRGASANLPLGVDHGAGSQYGNYTAQVGGETRGPSGERCVVFNWDRPLTQELAVRYKSASCESKDRPGVMICREISRTVIPIADSNLKDELGGANP